MNVEKLKVIFRMEYDPYMLITKYIAIFPECKETIYGDVACLPFWFNGDHWVFENHSTICRQYYHETTYIKDKKLLANLKNAVEEYYNNMPGDKTELEIKYKWGFK